MAEDEIKPERSCSEGERVDWSRLLYRRSFKDPERRYLNPDGTAHSRVFKLRPKDRGCLSVDVADMTTPERAVRNPAQHLLFGLRVKDVEDLEGITVHHDPEEGNDAHAAIWGMSEDDDITPALLARRSRLVVVSLV